jgi:hypothetical protein
MVNDRQALRSADPVCGAALLTIAAKTWTARIGRRHAGFPASPRNLM